MLIVILKIYKGTAMKSNLFAAVLMTIAFFGLNIQLNESNKVGINDFVECKDCK